MLLFDPDTHRYTLDGVPVPSVTQLVSPLGPDPEEDPDLELTVESAADRGLTMHAYIAHRLEGNAPEDFELPEAYSPYADAVELFLSEHTVDPLLIETPLPGPGFAGTPDLLCTFDGKISILDWKFVSQIVKSKVGAQLGGYRMLCEFNQLFPEALYAVQFLSDGTYRLYPADFDRSANAFRQSLLLRDLRQERHPRGRIF